MGLGFFDTFFDSEYRQRSDLNDLARNESAMADDVATLGGKFASNGPTCVPSCAR